MGAANKVKPFWWQYEDGILPGDQLAVLLALAEADRPKQVLEIGTFMGHTTRALAEALPDATIHTIDLPLNATVADIPGNDLHLVKQRKVGVIFRGKPCEQRIVQHYGNTFTYDFRLFGQPTFFFIDGAHTYEACRNDSQKCLILLGERAGTIIWHDCDARHPGVQRLLDEWKNLGLNILLNLRGMPLAQYKKRSGARL